MTNRETTPDTPKCTQREVRAMQFRASGTEPQMTNKSALVGNDERVCRVLIVLGPPGSGKGTQCNKLAQLLGIPHVSTGDILRDNIRRGTLIGSKAIAAMNHGNLVS